MFGVARTIRFSTSTELAAAYAGQGRWKSERFLRWPTSGLRCIARLSYHSIAPIYTLLAGAKEDQLKGR
jgi:hypothetical protein